MYTSREECEFSENKNQTINEYLMEQTIEEQSEVLIQLHKDTETVLQILIDNLSLSLGLYELNKYGGKWIKAI